MADVIVTPDAQMEFAALPLPMQERVRAVFARLRRWPEVSAAKPLRKSLKGAYRIRTGDWRVLFRVDLRADCVTVFRIDNRRDVYE